MPYALYEWRRRRYVHGVWCFIIKYKYSFFLYIYSYTHIRSIAQLIANMLMITLITNVWHLGRTYYITPAGNYLALSSLNTHWARRIPIPEYATLLFKHQQPCPWLSHSAQRIWWSRGVRGYPRNDLLLLAQGTSTAEGQSGGGGTLGVIVQHFIYSGIGLYSILFCWESCFRTLQNKTISIMSLLFIYL